MFAKQDILLHKNEDTYYTKQKTTTKKGGELETNHC